MKPNISTIDRVIRILIFFVAVILYFAGVTKGTTGIVLIVAGGILLLTAVVSFCPLYAIFGIRTNKKH